MSERQKPYVAIRDQNNFRGGAIYIDNMPSIIRHTEQLVAFTGTNKFIENHADV
jgi:hypothetical protein